MLFCQRWAAASHGYSDPAELRADDGGGGESAARLPAPADAGRDGRLGGRERGGDRGAARQDPRQQLGPRH